MGFARILAHRNHRRRPARNRNKIMKTYIFSSLLVLLVLQFAYSYGWGADSDDNDDQLDVYRAADKRAMVNLPCATISCIPFSKEISLRCCPGLRCKCGLLWSRGHCRCKPYTYG